MFLSAYSGREAKLFAATTAAPDEIPANIPSSAIKRCAISIASSDETRSTSSIKSKSKLP